MSHLCIIKYLKHRFIYYCLTRRVPLVEQKLLTLPEFTPGFSGVCVSWSLVLCVMFCRSLFVLFLLTIVLSVLLQFSDSDYPFDIFKLFYIYKSEWVSDCRLMPSEQFFSYAMADTSHILMRWWWCPLYTRSTHSCIFKALAYWNNSPHVDMLLLTTCRHVAPHHM